MSQQGQDIKIRALPRKSTKAKADPNGKATDNATGKDKSETVPRWIIYIGTVCILLISAVFVLPNPKAIRWVSRPLVQQADLSSQIPASDVVSNHLRESLMRQQMMRSRRELENMEVKALSPQDAENAMLDSDPTRTYGVQFDSEDTPERLFQELNGRTTVVNENLPDERISARLANRKWVSEMERADRVLFVRNFIRTAYDRGYQVEIDQNLVVVGVKKITSDKKVSIDQVLDQLGKKGF